MSTEGELGSAQPATSESVVGSPVSALNVFENQLLFKTMGLGDGDASGLSQVWSKLWVKLELPALWLTE